MTIPGWIEIERDQSKHDGPTAIDRSDHPIDIVDARPEQLLRGKPGTDVDWTDIDIRCKLLR